MGLFSFIKDVGESLGLTESETPEAETLEQEIAKYGLEAEGLEIQVEGDTVKIAGAAASQEVREKIILAAGNVKGIGAVEEEIAVTSGEAEPVFYTVQKGDTLWGISADQLGNGAKYEEIFEANKPMLSHPDKIYPGQVLRIPQ